MDVVVPERPPVPCCCGKPECDILQMNNTVMDRLESVIQEAASKGAALLVRHEAFMRDAQRAEDEMLASMGKLEKQNDELHRQNAVTINRSREYLDELEQKNELLSIKDAKLHDLEATVESTLNEYGRLSRMASQTGDLEMRLSELERDQTQLHETLSNTKEDKLMAIQRWQEAERTIASLEDHIDAIEREAKEERERHIEIVGRMERRRAVERDLQTAAGRLKGAAALKTAGHGRNGTNVVTHFVDGIMQDNANMQSGIAQLQKMLANSNEEVERLREQVILHQPLENGGQIPTPTLESELKLDGVDQERNPELHLHVHHHVQRRIKKSGRKSITPAHFTPTSGTHTPRASLSRLHPHSASPSAAMILQNTSVTIPQSNHRWSVQSNQTGTSIASSVPSSTYAHSRRPSSMFDRAFSEAAYDSSRPTTPDSSSDFMSPRIGPTKSPIPNEAFEDSELEVYRPPKAPNNKRNFTSPLPIRTIDTPTTSLSSPTARYSTSANPSVDANLNQQTIPEETEHEDSSLHTQSTTSPDDASDAHTPSDIFTPSFSRLRHSTSHESLISISGMDIHAYPHTLAHRPSQHLLSASPSGAVLSAHMAHATHTRSRGTHDSRALLTTVARTPSRPIKAPSPASSGATITQKVGGWISGRWGATPAPSSEPHLAALLAKSPGSGASSETSSLNPTPGQQGKVAHRKTFRMRPPGVNQSGPIWGFGPEPETPYSITVEDVDVDALGEALAEG